MLKDDTRIQLDLYANLDVDRIMLGRHDAEVRARAEHRLRRLSRHAQGGHATTPIDFHYSGTPKEQGRFGGIAFRKDPDGTTGSTPRARARARAIWWPNKDQWRDEVERMEISVAIPNDLVDVSNGKFVGKTDLGDGYTRWDWLVQYPINNYNVSLNIGNYVHFADRLGDLPLDFYVLPGNLEGAKRQFAQAKPMLEAYQHYFGEYPFKKDGYKLIEVPYSGMEHQSAVTYGNRFANGYLERDWTGVGISLKFDFIIIHESGHEWFGNAVSAADVSDMWIHEGWTTYLEALYVERLFGHDDALKYVNGYKTQGPQPRADHHPARHPPLAVAGHVLQGRALPQHAAQRRQRRRAVVEAAARRLPALQVPEHPDRGPRPLRQRAARQDLTPVFDQYLRRADLPMLELAFNEAEGTMAYRWSADERAFAMPIKVGTAGQWQTLRPTTDWQTMKTTLTKATVEVATDLYYVTVLK